MQLLLCLPRPVVCKAIKGFNELGHEGDSPRKGIKCSLKTESSHHQTHSTKFKETGILRKSIPRIAKNKLNKLLLAPKI